MNILFVIGGDLRINSSANLCHLAYIRGFTQAGHDVEILCARDDEASIDKGMNLPSGVTIHTYGVSLYEKLSHVKKRAARTAQNNGNPPSPANPETGTGRLGKIKERLRSLYGVYGPDHAWHEHAKNFTSDQYYDCVISVSCPFISHLTAHHLIKSSGVKCGKWIQIWEDPWYGDMAGDFHTDAVLREEKYLCELAEEIIYVSPVTLMYQQNLFPGSAHKMRFIPTPSYYRGSNAEGNIRTFGYFGDYEPSVRNLKPFYDAAKELDIKAYICGNSSERFEHAVNVEVYPRVPLSQLAVYEDMTGVLVFLCNLSGGQIPGKIFQYSASDKPILFILDGTQEEKETIKDYFGKFNRYVFCENTTEDIKIAAEYILSGKAPAKAIDNFLPEKTVERILFE